MYLSDYLVFILALLACMVFSMIAGGKVKSAYSAYSRVPCRSGLSGRDAAERLLRASYDALGLSARAHDRILRVARTVADLAGKQLLDEDCVLEALQYRAQEKVEV